MFCFSPIGLEPIHRQLNIIKIIFLTRDEYQIIYYDWSECVTVPYMWVQLWLIIRRPFRDLISCPLRKDVQNPMTMVLLSKCIFMYFSVTKLAWSSFRCVVVSIQLVRDWQALNFTQCPSNKKFSKNVFFSNVQIVWIIHILSRIYLQI